MTFADKLKEIEDDITKNWKRIVADSYENGYAEGARKEKINNKKKFNELVKMISKNNKLELLNKHQENIIANHYKLGMKLGRLETLKEIKNNLKTSLNFPDIVGVNEEYLRGFNNCLKAILGDIEKEIRELEKQ